MPMPRLSPLSVALSVALAAGALPAALGAQEAQPVAADSAPAQRRGWLVGVSAGVPGAEGGIEPSLFTVGVNVTQLRPGRPGADLAVVTVPRVIAEGFAVVGARAGVALPLVVNPNVLLVPSAGVSLLGAAGAGGGGGTAGLNAGAAAVLLSARGVGVRTGVTWHRFDEAGGGLWLLEFGFVRGPRGR